ncbi:MAG: T9SS type A sorting domain-containing protein, partial [Bacteroidota bacterium]
MRAKRRTSSIQPMLITFLFLISGAQSLLYGRVSFPIDFSHIPTVIEYLSPVADTSKAKACGDSSWVIGEVGSAITTDEWTRVEFQNQYFNPVVITGGLNRKGGHRTTVRVNNLTNTGFDIRLIDWECLNPNHSPEKLNYLVIESGGYILPNGKKIVAGNYGLVNQVWSNRLFTSSFRELPILLAQCVTEKESSPVVVQMDKDSLTNKQFRLRIRESLVADSVHTNERVSVIGIEKGFFTDSLFSFETGSKDLILSPLPLSVAVKGTYLGKTVFFGGIQTTQEEIAATINFRDLADDSIKIFLDYEVCRGLPNSQQEEFGNFLLFGEAGNIYACAKATPDEGEGLEDPNQDASILMPDLKFTLAPIPTDGSLTLNILEVDSENYQYEIINYAGQRVYSGTARIGVNQLRLESLSKGMYIIRVLSNIKASSQEFVV